MEGKLNCDVAQAMLHTWMHDMRGSDSDTWRYLFAQLFKYYKETIVGDTPPTETIPLLFVSAFLREQCSFSASLTAGSDEDKAAELAEFIADEISLVQAYTTAWQGSGTVEGTRPQNVED